MKSSLDADRRKIWPPHLTYSAFCLAARVPLTGLLMLTAVPKNAHSFCPVKQKQALLKSNPPRDNWTEGDEIKTVSTFGELKTPPMPIWRPLFQSPSHALKNLERIARRQSNTTVLTNKNTLSRCPFFRGKRISRLRNLSATRINPHKST